MAEYEVPGAVVGVYVPKVGEWVVAKGSPTSRPTSPSRPTCTGPPVDHQVLHGGHHPAARRRGRAALDDTIDQYIDGVPNGDQITVRQLAYMDSGLADYAATEAFGETLTADLSHQFTLEELNSFA